MVFSSLIFIVRFLPAFLTVYVLAPGRCRNLVLFLASLVFYAWGEPVYISLMLFSTFLDYGNGRVLEYARENGRPGLSRAVLLESVLVNLSLLGVFKYSGVLPLPVGISFYTFQTMSYTIDVYRGEVPAQKSLTAFGAYVSMFPEQMSTLTAWLGSGAYALQLYFDFSGYSDMAIGLAQMIGFHLQENFDYPYVSGSITEFWRRWHISLGQWFRDYVYIPLGGNRKGLLVQLRNILIVWALTGIWHGKGWNFLVWGMYFGVLLLLEKCFLLRWLSRCPAAVRHLYTMTAVLVGMTVFALDRLKDGLLWTAMLFGRTGCLWNGETIWLLSSHGILLALCIFGAAGFGKRLAERPSVWMLSFVLSIAYIVDAAYNPFLYFRF